MNPELDKELCEKYPKIFADRHAPMSTTAMCWGFECGDGWYNIIDALCCLIQNHIDNSIETCERNKEFLERREAALAGDWTLFDEHILSYNNVSDDWIKARKADLLEEPPEWRTKITPLHQVVASQVKEKFGTLRFYYNGGDDVIDGIVYMAEEMSSRTCEVCGNPGKTSGSGWLRTTCTEHTRD